MAARGATRRKKKTGAKTAGSKPPSGIQIKKANQGKMRKTAGAKSGQKISVQRLRQLKNSKNPTTRKRANFALNAKTKFGKPKKKKQQR